nr:Hint domain-containing protein [Rhodospirillales bacterium]
MGSANQTDTPFPLGAYLGNPDASNTSAENAFEASYNSFVSLMGAAPLFLDTFVDYTQPMSAWAGIAAGQAWSDAQSPDARNATPVIAMPLASTAPGSPSADAQFQSIASGQDDSVFKDIVNSYAGQGNADLVFRVGWEMNIAGPTYAGSTAQDQADWVAAYRHVYTVLHQAAAAAGIAVTVVWNPDTTNYSNVDALTALYPGNAYVDAIGADVYGDMYPYADGTNSSGQLLYHDWDTGREDTSVAQFIADPINRAHYWSWPAATEWSNDSSDGHALSLDQLIQFAEAQGKPLAIPEVGAGNSNAGTDVTDDPTFPQWLAQQIGAARSAGETIDFVNLWDSNSGGNYEFSFASDNKPLEAAAWAQSFGAVTDPPCFLAGTHIATPRGEVPVETLRRGDLVTTHDGKQRRLRWVGFGRTAVTPRNRDRATPVVVRRHALADGVPRRDLYLTRGHSLFFDGVLIPVEELINYRTIAWVEDTRVVEYYHLELDSHDVVIAEGAPAESYRDDGNNTMFHNARTRPATPAAPPCVP